MLLGLPFKDTWYISPGNSYISRLIDDAGGRYLWNDIKSSVSMPYSLENVYLQSAKAEFWLNTGSVNSKSEIAAFDPRLKAIGSFKNGNLYNNNKTLTKNLVLKQKPEFIYSCLTKRLTNLFLSSYNYKYLEFYPTR